MENISEHVKREREARGITIEELSKGTFISTAILKDIESGKFDKYKGDELYVKMYLRKIAKYLGLEERELDAEFEALTHEIQLEELRKEDFKRRLAEENKKNVTISEKVSDTFKDLKNVKPKKPISNKRVYEDRYLLRYAKYALVGVVCLGIVFVIWYAIVAGSSSDKNDNFNKTPTIEGNTDAGKQDTDQTDTPKKEEPTKPLVEITKNSELDYSFKLDQNTPTFKFKIEFVGRSWANLKVNGRDYSEFKSGIYNNENKSNALDAKPEVVELEFQASDFENLQLKLGYFMGHRFYINDQEIEIDANQYDGQPKPLKLHR